MTSICKVDNVVSERLTSRLEFDNDDRNKLFFFLGKSEQFAWDEISSTIGFKA